MKKIVSALLVFTLLFTGSFIGISNTANAAQDTTAVTTTTATEDEEMRGIWVSFKDYESLGMVNKNEKIYIKNVKKFVKTAKKKKFNTIFLHVRAYDDAIWMSDTFAASEYLTKKASRSKTAAETYSYDPLEDFIEVAAAYGLEVHAWLNPYRVTDTMYLNPAKKTNMNRVKTAVKELMEYDIAGIHFDDYFYHSQGGYISSYKSTDVYSKDITAKKKRINVNKLVKSVYKLVHKNNLVFGISPQGNFDNDMNSGADVESWLSKDGYVDYVAPQIY
nr:family 10 glycosylhydrolase [Lachnospiraceae bacterium]